MIRDFFVAFCLLFSLSTGAQEVLLSEDEFILPPYLSAVAGGDILNITSNENRKYQAKTGEWIEYGDRFDLPARQSLLVILRENLQWVGGGVFQSRLGTERWNEKVQTYDIFLDRGWMKIWMTPDRWHHKLRIVTPQTSLTVEQGVFWLNVRTGATEAYLVSGELTDGVGAVLKGKNFFSWNSVKKGVSSTTSNWDEAPMLVHFSGPYPSLVALSEKAEKLWNTEKTASIYADLRKTGWRKHSRLESGSVNPNKNKK